MADFLSVGKPISFARPISLDVRFGPFESVSAAYQNVGPNGLDAIYAGLVFCVVANNKVEFYKWTKSSPSATVNDVEKIVPDLKTINGKLIIGTGDIVIKDVIVIAGVKTSGTELSGTGGEATSSEVYYYSEKGVLGFSINGGTSYYTRWANENEFGTFMIWDPNYSSGNYSGNLKGVVPLINRLYLDSSTGDVKFCSDRELQDVASSFVPTSAQENAMNSGITKAKVESLDALIALGLTSADITELRRLKGMGISHDATNDLLTINKKQYDLSGGGGSTPVEITYGTPTVTLSYPSNISNEGGTYNPEVTVTQPVNKNGTFDHNDTYSSLSELINEVGQENVSFEYVGSTRFSSLNANNGQIVVNQNESSSTKTVTIKINVTIHGNTVNDTDEIVQNGSTSQNKIYITKVEYDTAGLTDGNGYTTILPTLTASDGNTYSVNTYTALGSANIESFSFGCDNAYGATVNSSTGAITYKVDTMISNILPGNYIRNIHVKLTQEDSSHNKSAIEVDILNYDVSTMTELLTLAGVRCGSDGGAIHKDSSLGLSTITLELNAGDVIAIKNTFNSSCYISIFETYYKLVNETNGVAKIANSDMWTTNGTSNFTKFVTNSGGKETHYWYEKKESELVYKVLGNVAYTNGTTRVTIMYYNPITAISGSVYYKKLN